MAACATAGIGNLLTEDLLVRLHLGTGINPINAHCYDNNSYKYEDGLSHFLYFDRIPVSLLLWVIAFSEYSNDYQQITRKTQNRCYDNSLCRENIGIE